MAEPKLETYLGRPVKYTNAVPALSSCLAFICGFAGDGENRSVDLFVFDESKKKFLATVNWPMAFRRVHDVPHEDQKHPQKALHSFAFMEVEFNQDEDAARTTLRKVSDSLKDGESAISDEAKGVMGTGVLGATAVGTGLELVRTEEQMHKVYQVLGEQIGDTESAIYGPFQCAKCRTLILQKSQESGGEAYESLPDGPPHFKLHDDCNVNDSREVAEKKAIERQGGQQAPTPHENQAQLNQQGCPTCGSLVKAVRQFVKNDPNDKSPNYSPKNSHKCDDEAFHKGAKEAQAGLPKKVAS